jgi:hypothetical protein
VRVSGDGFAADVISRINGALSAAADGTFGRSRPLNSDHRARPFSSLASQRVLCDRKTEVGFTVTYHRKSFVVMKALPRICFYLFL